MKLTYFSEQTCPKQNGGGYNKLPRISFGKNGVITFNQEACRLLGLKAKEKVSLGQDPDSPENWYCFKDAQHGFELRSGYKGKSMQFNHVSLVKMIMEALGKEVDKSHTFKIAGQPTTIGKTQYWGILMAV